MDAFAKFAIEAEVVEVLVPEVHDLHLQCLVCVSTVIFLYNEVLLMKSKEGTIFELSSCDLKGLINFLHE